MMTMVTLLGDAEHAEAAVRDVDEIAHELGTLAATLAATTCRFLLLLAEFDERRGWERQGVGSVSHWLSWRCGMSTTTAREQVRVARRLAALPQTIQQFAAGRLSYSKVRAITRVATPETEAELLDIAAAATANQLDRFVAGVATATSVEEVNARHSNRYLTFRTEADGSVTFSGRCSPEDGAAILERLRLVQDYLQRTAIDDGQHSTDTPAASWDEHQVTQGRALIDALVLLCDQAGVGSESEPTTADEAIGSRRSETVLHVTLDELAAATAAGRVRSASAEAGESAGAPAEAGPAQVEPGVESDGASAEASGPGDASAEAGAAGTPAEACAVELAAEAGPAEVEAAAESNEASAEASGPGGASAEAWRIRIGSRLEVGPALHPETARRLCCDTGLVLSVHELAADPGWVSVMPNPRAGGVLRMGRRRRLARRAQLRALWDRDHGCRFPGCERRRYLHAHHIVHWADGGPTDLDNLVLLCGQHHRLLHEGAYAITLDRDKVTVRDPHGRRLAAVPPPHAPEIALVADVEGTAESGAALPLDPVDGGALELEYAVGVVAENWRLQAERAAAIAS